MKRSYIRLAVLIAVAALLVAFALSPSSRTGQLQSPVISPLDSPIGKIHPFTPTPEEIRHHYTAPKQDAPADLPTPEPTATTMPLLPITGGGE